jgi:hypothetical protein
MKEIRLIGIPIGETKTRENYYLEKPEEILRTVCVVDGINENGFTKLLYYPQYSEKTIGTKVVRTPIGTTLMVETKDELNGRKKWETIGHVWGVKDSKLEELGFQKWEKNDYKVPDSKIEILVLNEKTVEALNRWMVEQGIEPFVYQKSPTEMRD